MAQSMIRACAAGALQVVALYCATPFARAEILADPTRPPNAAPATAGRAGAGATGGSVLQSTFISGGRRFAIISGQTVVIGDRLGDAQIVRISESEVALRQNGAMKTLKLFPELEKRAVVEQSAATAGQRR
jgi:MSHA biogenesis protein MshK